MDDDLLVGAHVSVAGGVDNAPERQRDVGGNCGQIFTHSPQVWRDPTVGDDEAARFREATAERIEGPWVIHTSYLVNLCTPKADLRAKSLESMQGEVDAAAALGVEYVNVHLGAHTGAGVEGGLEHAASVLDDLDVPEAVTVLVESDAGAGTKLGGQFEHLARVQELTDLHLGFCLDTAHAWAAGYDLSDAAGVDETLAAFDDGPGLENLHCIHLNDSVHGCGTHKDEHAHLGEGEIGEDGVRAVVNHPDLRDVPLVLETPNEPERGKGFAYDIDTVRELREPEPVTAD
ncbi:MAG: deoxyribonuclease IV [Halobacteriaceae archaeon]